MRRRPRALAAVAVAAACTTLAAQQPPGEERFRYKSSVDLVNVTATVTDRSGRFVPDLDRADFEVYEDGELQQVSHFERERVPVSLGIVLDVSNSMAGEKIRSAQMAIRRFTRDLLDPDDELFLVRFSDEVEILQKWTTDRDRLERAIGRLTPYGATSLYDAVLESVPLANGGTHPKKALVVISDGNDTSSTATPREVRNAIRHSDVLVYAIGIDGNSEQSFARRPVVPRPYPPPTYPGPVVRRPTFPPPPTPQPPPSPGSWTRSSDRVNADALRALTDDTGGRTEIIDSIRNLGPATAGIADELSQQYFLGYSSSRPRDGRWHEIDVFVKGDRGYIVRARSGYLAAP